tara:strand:- start:3305 stop:3856 length:552 start_codon:yes stop_codon:yes gene_type:complete
MKYLKITKTESGTVWLLDSDENSIYQSSFKTKKEFENHVVSVMINDVIGKYPLSHLVNGSPFLIGLEELNISISHSNNLFTIYASKNNTVGIDVELVNKELSRGKHYFLNEEEITVDWTNQELYMIWCAKEAYYKLLKGNVKAINKELTILKINNQEIQGQFKNEPINFSVERLKDIVLVYTK